MDVAKNSFEARSLTQQWINGNLNHRYLPN